MPFENQWLKAAHRSAAATDYPPDSAEYQAQVVHYLAKRGRDDKGHMVVGLVQLNTTLPGPSRPVWREGHPSKLFVESYSALELYVEQDRVYRNVANDSFDEYMVPLDNTLANLTQIPVEEIFPIHPSTPCDEFCISEHTISYRVSGKEMVHVRKPDQPWPDFFESHLDFIRQHFAQ